jgi:hypothetical protein
MNGLTRVPRPRLSVLWRDRAGACSSVTSLRRPSVVPSPHAGRTKTISGSPLPPLHNLQLLPPCPTLSLPGLPPLLRANPRTGPPLVRVSRDGIRRHARTRPSTTQRTRKRKAIHRTSDAEANHSPSTHLASPRRHLLASPILRLQRMERAQAHREAEIHPSQPGKTRLVREPGRLAMEQFPSPPLRG